MLNAKPIKRLNCFPKQTGMLCQSSMDLLDKNLPFFFQPKHLELAASPHTAEGQPLHITGQNASGELVPADQRQACVCVCMCEVAWGA